MAKDVTTCKDNDEVSTFLATQVNFTEADFSPHIRVFWSDSSSSSTSDGVVIQERIKSAFCKSYLCNLNGLIQFWAPVTTSGGRLVLSASYQPFALENLSSSCFLKYRLSCMGYQYDIDNNNNNNNKQLEEPLIINGPAGNAFLNRLPILVVNRRDRGEGNPLVHSALECELTCSLFLPVFYHQTSSCVGVVECSMKRESSLLVIFNNLKTALERVCLSTFNVQDCLPYKSICSLKPATDEIENALEIVCESHYLTLAQVWIPYEDEIRFPFSSPLVDTQTQRRFAVKLIGCCADSNDDGGDLMSIKDYYDTCDMLPLNIGEGISGKTLESYEPRFCINIDELRDIGLLALLPSDTECSCLVICLRSMYTGDHVDYLFEFLWPQSRNYFILLESLLLTLKRCLPSFKFASGAQLGDELRVLDAENSTGSGIGSFNILEKNRISPIPKALEERRSFVAEDCISSSSGRKLNRVTEWQEPDFSKRKLSDLCKSSHEYTRANQAHPAISNRVDPKLTDSGKDTNFWVLLDATLHSGENQEHSSSSNSVRCPGNDGLVTKVEYGDDIMLSYIPISSKLADIKKSIDDKYNMGPGNYKLQFLDSLGDWIRLVDEEDWEICNIHCRSTKTQTIRLRVLPSTNLMMCAGANQEHPSSCNSFKRKLTDLCETRTESCQEDTGANQELPSSSKRKLTDLCETLTESRQEDTRENQEHPSSSNSFKRKLTDLCETRTESCQEDTGANQEHPSSWLTDLLKPLLIPLKRCLSSFKLSSDAQLGDSLPALDVEMSTRLSPIPEELGCKMTPTLSPREDVKQPCARSINNDPRNHTASVCKLKHKSNVEMSTRISPIPKELGCKMSPTPLPREDVKQPCGSSINNDARNRTANHNLHFCKLKRKSNVLGNSQHQGLKFVKRKLSDFCKSKVDSNLKDNSSNQEHYASSSKSLRYPGNDELMMIKAEYGDHQTLLYFPVSSKVENIRNNINEKYKLSPGSYKLQFLDFEDEWINLDNDQDWESCMKSWRAAGTENIQLRVLLRQC